MAKRKRKTTPRKKNPEVPASQEPLEEGAAEQLLESEVLAGQGGLGKGDPDSSIAEPGAFAETTDATRSSRPAAHKRGLTTSQKVLIVGLIATAGLLAYFLLGQRSRLPRPPRTRRASEPQLLARPVSAKTSEKYSVDGRFEDAERTGLPTEPVSLRIAEELYSKKDYDRAYVAYSRLRRNLLAPDDELLRDFLQMRMAFCMEKSGDFDDARHLLRMVSQSRSPVLRATANYHMCLLEIQAGQYLKARTRAYKAIALAGALTFDWDWALGLERDCHFVVAEAMTREILSLSDQDKELPEELWRHRLGPDPLTGLAEAELRAVLSNGREQLSQGVLGPQIRRLERQGNYVRFSIVCHGPSVAELMSKLAANAGLDVHWTSSSAATEGAARGQTGLIRKRPVSMYMPAATTRQAALTVAGCAGLLAEFDDDGNIYLSNPAEYPSLSQHIRSLTAPAISLWQHLLLTYYDDVRLPNAHFALGLLQEQRGLVTEAIAEYKLVTNLFGNTPPAPYALMRSSKLKARMRDYSGARLDLKQLIEQHPDSEITGQAYLQLAETTTKAELYEEAAYLYRKVYNLGLSTLSQTIAALGAGKSFYRMEDYESAAKWLRRYIDLAEASGPAGQAGKELYAAYFLLGESNLALGKLEQACKAYQATLSGRISREQYVETVAALVEAQSRRENYVEALKTLENMYPWPFSRAESARILLLRSRVLRAMGLIDEAVTVLGDRAQYLTDADLKAGISFELTKCYRAEGKLELARTKLAELLSAAEPGPLADEIALELADVSMVSGRNSQTISICSQLLHSQISAQTRQRATELLATAHSREKNYDKAALVLLGR